MSDAAAQNGASFGKYRDAVLLGQGGMGAVYRAYDASLDRFVAIKVLTHKEWKYLERFRREAQVVAKLNHPNIIQIFEIVGSDDDSVENDPYIVMEFFDGQPLDSLLKMGPVPQAQLVNILRQSADGLRKAHGALIIHRDIKPANILVSGEGHVKIVDFGIAKALEAKKDLTGQTVLGTPYYMSPEQAMGQKIDGRTDIYSLGITAYHLLTGKRPFEAKSKVDVMLAQVKQPLPDIRELAPQTHPQLVGLIEKMCAKPPGARFQTCAELVAALDALPAEIKQAQAPSGMPTPVAVSPVTPAASTPLPPSAAPPPLPPQTGQAPGAVRKVSLAAELPPPRGDAAPTPAPGGPVMHAPTPPPARPVAAPGQASRAPTPAPRDPLQMTLETRAGQGGPLGVTLEPLGRAAPRTSLKASAPLGPGLALVGGAIVLAALAGFGVAAVTAKKPGGDPNGPFRVPDDGWSTAAGSPVKRVHLPGNYGNCVFASGEIKRGAEDANALKTDFLVGEPVDARCYFGAPLGKTEEGEVFQAVFIDGEERSRAYYEPALAPATDEVPLSVTEKQGKRFARLSEGPHSVWLWIMRQRNGETQPVPLAGGAFNVEKR